MTETDPALLVAYDDESRETETPAALHHLCDAVDMDQLVHKFAIALFPVVLTCHFARPLN
jgi:hypothetical protein